MTYGEALRRILRDSRLSQADLARAIGKCSPRMRGRAAFGSPFLVDEYIAAFGEPDEGETAVLSVTVPAATHRAIKDEATRRGCSMRDLIV